MFTHKCIWGPSILLSLSLLALPCLAQPAGSGYDQMEGEFIRPHRRPTPKRNFNQDLPRRHQVKRYEVRRTTRPTSIWSSAHRPPSLPSNSSEFINPQTRPYVPRVNRVMPETDDQNQYSEPQVVTDKKTPPEDHEAQTAKPDKAHGKARTVEVSDTPSDNDAKAPSREALNEDQIIVYCTRQLYEYHLDRYCPMIGDVDPTPMTLKEAKETGFVPCIHCAKPKSKKK